MYLWNDDMDKLSANDWSLDRFITTRLKDWLALFDGMELVGNDTLQKLLIEFHKFFANSFALGYDRGTKFRKQCSFK